VADSPQVAKSYWRGTHRTVAPSETLRRFRPHAAALGITRLHNITGLDYLGVPVCMAVRPNARTLSVSQGKGLDDASAAASAFMEAVELEHAECVAFPRRFCSYNALKSEARVVNPARLPRIRRSRFHAGLPIPWVEGTELGGGNSIWVPFEVVHSDHTVPQHEGSGCFLPISNGLASGNHELEAICAALCEVIERDATRLWRLRTATERAMRRLDLDSVTAESCRELVGRLQARDMTIAVWDATTDIGIACFICRIRETPANTRSRLGSFWGSGCHVTSDVALIRAIAEAAQSRLTYIAGARDDLRSSSYSEPSSQALLDLARDAWETKVGGRRFDEVPTALQSSFEQDLLYLLERLCACDLHQAITVNLTRPPFDIPVVRVIVPGLEGDDDHARYLDGPRARAMMRSLH
jgi:ribosomal protein S12 methylthiotransferase accessory factor